MMNPMTGDLLDALISKGKKGKQVVEDRSHEEVAKDKVIKNEQGQIGLPPEYLYACLNNAGRNVAFDTKKKMATATSSLIPSFLTIENEFLKFKNQKEPMVVDKRRGVLNNAGKMVAVGILRPKFKNWEFEIDLIVDEKEINPAKIKELFEKAGNTIGLGDFRPQKRGPFGRFMVAVWQVVGEKQSNGVGSAKEAASA